MNRKTIARGLAWSGVGLGLAELFFPRRVAEAAGLEGRETLIRLFGLREIASGAVLLASDEPDRLLWLRVAGDLLDGAVLGQALLDRNKDRRRPLATALLLAPVVAGDIAVWLDT